MTTKTQARIVGMGSYLPKRILTNSDIEKLVESSDEWIVQRTGISERRIADDEETTSYMGFEAAKIALEKSGIPINEIGLILVATMSGDYKCPGTAPLIQQLLGAKKAAAVDVQAACSGHLCALSIAKAYIEAGLYRHVLVISSEKMSSVINYQDRGTCILFGDGASAAVVSGKGAGYRINHVVLGSDGEYSELIIIPGGGCKKPFSPEVMDQNLHYLKMDGKEVFKHAVRRMIAACNECMELSGLTKDQFSWLVPHQANERIIDAIARGMDFPNEKIFKTVHKYGNTSAPSVAISMDELTQEADIKEGEHLLLTVFGAGLSWGAATLTAINHTEAS